MSVRQRATQCLGKQLPDHPHSRPCNSTSRWPVHHVRWHEEQESSKQIRTSSSHVAVASERVFRSRETVKAWLESSPTSVLEDLDDESACPSSFESSNCSPAGSVDHLSCTTRFQNPIPKGNPPGHARSRTISPPRCAANKNSVDLSRIDPAHYSGGSFLMLAFKNAQHRGSSSPPAFQYTSEAVGNDYVPSLNTEECGSPGSEFSLTSEWQYMLAAGNAAGNAADMSTRDSCGTNSEFETPCEVVNASDVDLHSDVSNLRAQPQAMKTMKSHCRTRSMELPPSRYTHNRSASVGVEGILVENNKHTRASAKLERRQSDAGSTYGKASLRRLLRRDSIQKSQYDMTMRSPKAEEKQATAEVKRPEKIVRANMEAKIMRQTGKVSRGCLFLV